LDDAEVELPQGSQGSADGLADYEVNAGQRIRVEFTFENNGTNRQSGVPVGFYLSRDRVLGLGDIRLAGAVLTLTRNQVFERIQTIDLPADLASGDTYFIIAVIDPWGEFAEVYEDNNFSHSRRFVEVASCFDRCASSVCW
jgi:hypothetical protein